MNPSVHLNAAALIKKLNLQPLTLMCLLARTNNQSTQPKHIKLVVIKKTWILTKAIMIGPWYFGFSESAQKYLVFIWFLCLFENHCYCKGIFVFLELNKCHFVKKFASFLQHYFSV